MSRTLADGPAGAVPAAAEDASSAPAVLRADARRNRDQIIAAAARAFVEDGPDVPMDQIARAAGVGVGTLYRRFADRESLMVAVLQHSLATLLDDVRRAAAEEPRAWDALVVSMSYSRELRASVPIASSLPPEQAARLHDDPVVRGLRRELSEAADELVRAAQQEGTLRPDVGGGDVTRLFSLVRRGAQNPRDEAADLGSRRALGVILDGLRAAGHEALPGRPIRTRDLQAG